MNISLFQERFNDLASEGLLMLMLTPQQSGAAPVCFVAVTFVSIIQGQMRFWPLC